MIPLRSITSRTITAPASLVRRSTRASTTTPALKLGWKVDGVSPMGCSALADIAAQMPESATHLAQEPAQSAVSMNREGSDAGKAGSWRADAVGRLIRLDLAPDRIQLARAHWTEKHKVEHPGAA